MSEHTMFEAHRMVRKALKAGILTPEPCEVCGDKNVLAHHDDYKEPLKVRWLCRKHHVSHHREHGEGANRFWFDRDWLKTGEILHLGAILRHNEQWCKVDQSITVGKYQKVRVIVLD